MPLRGRFTRPWYIISSQIAFGRSSISVARCVLCVCGTVALFTLSLARRVTHQGVRSGGVNRKHPVRVRVFECAL